MQQHIWTRRFPATTLKKMGDSNNTSTIPLDIAVLTLFGIVGLVGSIGNFCICVSLFINRNLRRITHLLIMNLALSDFLLCALSIPLRILRICARKSIFESKVLSSDTYCRVTSGLNVAVLGTSSLGFLLLTVDKVLAVKHPLSYRTGVHKKYMIAPILLSWPMPLLLGLCGAFIPALQADLSNQSHDVACITSSTCDETFALCTYFTVLVIPLILMLPMYVYIIFKVKKSGRVLNQSNSDDTNRDQPVPTNNRKSAYRTSKHRRDMKLTKGIVIILGAHLFCLTPIIVLDFVHIFLQYPIPYILDEVFLLLLHLNAILDPVIYTRHSHDIKRTMMRLFCPFQNRVRGIQNGQKLKRRATTITKDANQHTMYESSSIMTTDGNRMQKFIHM